jgi:hypothetical protein
VTLTENIYKQIIEFRSKYNTQPNVVLVDADYCAKLKILGAINMVCTLRIVPCEEVRGFAVGLMLSGLEEPRKLRVL